MGTSVMRLALEFFMVRVGWGRPFSWLVSSEVNLRIFHGDDCLLW